MFLGGIDPNELRRRQEQIRRALQSVDFEQLRTMQEQIEQARQGVDLDQLRRFALTYRPLVDLVQTENAWSKLQEASQVYVNTAQTLRPPFHAASPDMIRSLQTAAEVLNAAEFRNTLAQRLEQARAFAEAQLGLDGLTAAQHIAARQAETPETLQRAETLFRNGKAGELLTEAVELAASAEVLETIERADKEEILRLAQEQEARGEVLAPDVVDTTELTAEKSVDAPLSRKELLELHDVALRAVFLLGAGLAATLAISDPTSQSFVALVLAINSLTLFLEFSERQIASWEAEDEQDSD